MAMVTTCTIVMTARWRVSKRAVAAATTRAMVRTARAMMMASERALTMATKRAMEMEGEVTAAAIIAAAATTIT